MLIIVYYVQMKTAPKKIYPAESLIKYMKEDNLINNKDSGSPHLVTAGDKNSPDCAWYLVIDGSAIPVGNNFLKAFDLLFKSFFVFNLHYPPDLTPTFSFFESLVYKMSTATSSLPSVQVLAVSLQNV